MSADSDDVQNSTTPPEPSHEPPSEHRQPKWAWWVIGILIPALAIAVPVLVSGWPSSPNTDAPADAATPSASTSSSAEEQNTASPSTEVPAPSASLPDNSNAIQYTGSVRIAESGPQLDYKPPKLDRYTQDVRLALVNPPRIATRHDSDVDLAVWHEQKMPTRQECSDLISTQGVWMVEVEKGTVVCLRTQEGRTAVLTVTSTSNSFGTGVTAQATVWSEISD